METCIGRVLTATPMPGTQLRLEEKFRLLPDAIAYLSRERQSRDGERGQRLPGRACLASGLVHAVSVIAATPGDAVNDLAGHADVDVLVRHAVLLRHHPQFACAVINLVDARAGRAVPANNSAGNCHFFIIVAAGIVADV